MKDDNMVRDVDGCRMDCYRLADLFWLGLTSNIVSGMVVHLLATFFLPLAGPPAAERMIN